MCGAGPRELHSWKPRRVALFALETSTLTEMKQPRLVALLALSSQNAQSGALRMIDTVDTPAHSVTQQF
jgi:hypothetical protein